MGYFVWRNATVIIFLSLSFGHGIALPRSSSAAMILPVSPPAQLHPLDAPAIDYSYSQTAVDAT